MLRRFALCICLLALLGCVTTGGGTSAPAPVADSENARLAAGLAEMLDQRARGEAASLDGAEAEMRALDAALQPPSPPPQAELALPTGSVPELEGGRSLFHAIHIASYRGEATARAGWQTLAAMFPEALTGLEPRIEGVDIPGQGVFLRLKAGPFNSSGEAEAACAPFRSAGVWCAATDFTGAELPDHE